MPELRITAGELGGRRIRVPKGARDLRPTTERVREAVFSILGDISGTRVLDLFSGSGALAIEALSRGASEATLVDTRPATARRNLDSPTPLPPTSSSSYRGCSPRVAGR